MACAAGDPWAGTGWAVQLSVVSEVGCAGWAVVDGGLLASRVTLSGVFLPSLRSSTTRKRAARMLILVVVIVRRGHKVACVLEQPRCVMQRKV